MPDIKTIADKADMIVNGYAFTRAGAGSRLYMFVLTIPVFMFLGNKSPYMNKTTWDISTGKWRKRCGKRGQCLHMI